MHFDNRYARQQRDGIIISMENYYNPQLQNPDEISEPAKDVMSEIQNLNTKMISPHVVREMTGVVATLIESENARKIIVGSNALKDLLKFIENKANFYDELVKNDGKGETIYNIISKMNIEYLCNGGKLKEISRKEPGYNTYINQLDIIKSMRLLWKRFPFKDKIKETSLVYEPFPIDKNDINKRSNSIKAQCAKLGGYDRYNDYNYSPEYSREIYNGGYDRYNDNYYNHRDSYNGGYDNFEMYGGNDIELNKLREDIGRTNFDIELNRLRNELFIIRNNL